MDWWLSPPVHISVTGIGNHRINDIKVGTVGGVLLTQLGKVIGIFNNYANVDNGHSIHSCIQLEHSCNQVDNRHPSLGGKATIVTNDGYVSPLSFISGCLIWILDLLLMMNMQVCPMS